MRKLMWFTIGYALSCAVGTYLVRDSRLLILAAAFGLLALAGFHFRVHPLGKRAGMLFLGTMVGFLAFSVYAQVVLRPAAVMNGKEADVAIRVTGYSWETEYGIAADGELELSGRTYKVRFYVNEDRKLEPGDVVRIHAQLRLTDEGGIQEPTFHRTQGTLLLAYPRGEPTVEEGEAALRDLPAIWAERLKEILDGCFRGIRHPLPRPCFWGTRAISAGNRAGSFPGAASAILWRYRDSM